MRALVCAACVTAVLAGCGESQSIDSTPEKLDGSESQEFESDDIKRAENAPPLVETYCGDVPSEAQKVGCLSHVTVDDVCAEDTPGKQEALAEYREETGDDAVCD